ncbi:MAG: diguanylate cyclase domain-containing protein [Dissulfurispiraceae bacterium]
MKFLSLVAFFACIVYIFLGFYTYRLSRRSKLNCIFSLLCMDFALWAFACTFFYSAPDKQTAWFWYHVSSPGWCFSPALTLHFFLILTGHKTILEKKWVYQLLYLPGAIFMYKTLTGTLLVSDFLYRGLGWCAIAPSGTMWFWAYVFYYSGFVLTCFTLTYKWRRSADNNRLKKQTKVILALAFPVFIVSIFTDAVLPALGIYTMPSVACVLILVWILGIWYAIVKYKLMNVTTAMAAEDIVSAMYDLLILVNHEGAIIKLNRRTIEMLGIDESELIGKQLDILFEEKEFIREKFNSAAHSNHSPHCELNIKTINGQLIPLNLSCSAIRDDSGDPIGYAIVGQDLRQMKQLQAEIADRKSVVARLHYMTLFDPYTGLPNRKLFFDRMTQIIANSKRGKSMCALLLVALDGIEHLTISSDRETGGILLKETAARLEKYARDSDIAARISEDAFAIMMPKIHGSDELQEVAGRIRASLLKPYGVIDQEYPMYISIGTGIYPTDGESVDALLKKAIRDKQTIKTFGAHTDPTVSDLPGSFQADDGFLQAFESID